MSEHQEANYWATLTADVRYSQAISDGDKILFAEITSLSNKYGFCYASNAYFAEQYGISKQAISQRIKRLEKACFIRVVIDKKSGNKRRIYPVVDVLARAQLLNSKNDENTYQAGIDSYQPQIDSYKAEVDSYKAPVDSYQAVLDTYNNKDKQEIEQEIEQVGSAHPREDEPPPTEPPSPAKKPPSAQFDFFSALIEAGAEEQAADDFMAVRKAKKAVNSQTAFDGFCREVQKAGISIAEAVRLCAEQNWKGFTAQWYSNHRNSGANHASNSTANRKLTPFERNQQIAERYNAELAGSDFLTEEDYRRLGIKPPSRGDDDRVVAVIG